MEELKYAKIYHTVLVFHGDQSINLASCTEDIGALCRREMPFYFIEIQGFTINTKADMETLLNILKYIGTAYFDISTININYIDWAEWSLAIDTWFSGEAFQRKSIMITSHARFNQFAFHSRLATLLYGSGKFVVQMGALPWTPIL